MRVGDLVTVIRGSYADDFKHHALEVHLGPRGRQESCGEQILAQRIVVAGDDVRSLCIFLPRICYNHYHFSEGSGWIPRTVDVELNVQSNAIPEDEKDGCDNDPLSVKRLLEPFRQVYGYNVAVAGHVTSSYKESIEACANEVPPDALKVIRMASKGRDEGNEAVQKGNLGVALSQYESALHVMTSAYKRFAATRLNLAEWGIADKEDLMAMDKLQLNLRSFLADAYLQLGKFAKSYGCAQDLDCWYDLDAQTNISIQPDLVRMMFCKALAGKALGEPVQALRDLDEALRYDPNDEAMREERKVLCGLVRKKLHSDVRMTWADGLNARTGKLKKPNKLRKVKRSRKPQPAAEGYSLGERKDLEELMDKEIA